ncbi:hypothetical protein PHJA_001544600 [Phtheirospermum japonicum]|uniref:Uncharacterized protein n=1 Tax=Phtheirospermum japonicum TaxID=374723 RepID=A0A830C759_9LAMI|nr:hypothetical protein PHJA_001544600 [Phtheirospermum japonicum]
MSNPGKRTTDDDEVEQLLRAAQDEMLLKLSLNSHVARASASAAIDPDLDRRFEALRKPQKPAKIDDPAKKLPAKTDACASSKAPGAVADDDLFARFAALKSSLHSEQKSSVRDDVEEEESEDEVEKVINWAIDAARLDPSPPSDDDASDDDDSDDDDDVDIGKKGKRK